MYSEVQQDTIGDRINRVLWLRSSLSSLLSLRSLYCVAVQQACEGGASHKGSWQLDIAPVSSDCFSERACEKQMERPTGLFVVPTLVGDWLFESPTEAAIYSLQKIRPVIFSVAAESDASPSRPTESVDFDPPTVYSNMADVVQRLFLWHPRHVWVLRCSFPHRYLAASHFRHLLFDLRAPSCSDSAGV